MLKSWLLLLNPLAILTSANDDITNDASTLKREALPTLSGAIQGVSATASPGRLLQEW